MFYIHNEKECSRLFTKFSKTSFVLKDFYLYSSFLFRFSITMSGLHSKISNFILHSFYLLSYCLFHTGIRWTNQVILYPHRKLSYVNSSVNPFVYSYLLRSIRQAMYKTLSKSYSLKKNTSYSV